MQRWAAMIARGWRALLLASSVLAMLGGCGGARNQAYDGPARPAQQVAVISPTYEAGIQDHGVALLAINGRQEIGEWRGGGVDETYLLPGQYTLRVEFKQASRPLLMPVVDLALLVDDAITASEHRETDITVIVQPGIVYRIHYQPDRHVFFVSTVQSGAMKQPMTLAPPAQAVECVAHPDRSRELWCGLGPQH